jgi:hypothetical protein
MGGPFLDRRKRGADILYTKEDFKGKGPERVFSDAEIEVRKTDLNRWDELKYGGTSHDS